MISEQMKKMVEGSSAIREMFEEGNRLSQIYGRENVFDFSLGNPNVPAPEKVKTSVLEIINREDPVKLHGYTSNNGFEDVREKISASLNKRFKTAFNSDNIIMTCGAAAGLNVILKTIINPDDEVIVFAPYFGEYRSYVSNYNGKIIEVRPDKNDFLPDLDDFRNKISVNTKAVIINTPNNPTGVIYSEDIIKEIADILYKRESEYGHCIYLISDEPYREIVYDSVEIPYISKYYNNTIVAYSYSKSLSLPGERIGYIVIPDEVKDSEEFYEAACIANRILGFVNAPTLQQKLISMCLEEKTEISYYLKNRDLLTDIMDKCGFEYIKPQGAFYLFVKSPEEDEKSFCEKGKKYNILMVPGSAFSCPGYVRIAYCVSYETIKASEKAFKKLAEEYF